MTYTFDFSDFGLYVDVLAHGVAVTLGLTAVSTLLGGLVGIGGACIAVAGPKPLRAVVAAYVELIRNTPFLVQLFFLFYVLPTWGITFSPLVTGIVGLGLFNSAQTSEIYRAGIEDVPRGQWEAALTIGLPLKRVWLGIILPQTFHRVLPVLGNVIISMFKETSVLSTITVFELLAQGVDIGFQRFRFIEPLTMVGMMYFVISYAAARGVRFLEARNAVHH